MRSVSKLSLLDSSLDITWLTVSLILTFSYESSLSAQKGLGLKTDSYGWLTPSWFREGTVTRNFYQEAAVSSSRSLYLGACSLSIHSI
jgi:hypothetical protein